MMLDSTRVSILKGYTFERGRLRVRVGHSQKRRAGERWWVSWGTIGSDFHTRPCATPEQVVVMLSKFDAVPWEQV